MSLEDIRYWFEDLELRKKLEENQSIVLIGLILVIVFALGLVVCQMTGGSGSYTTSVQLVYFDTTNQQIRLVDHEYPALPTSPLEGSDDVFLATVFACEECEKGKIKDGMTLADLEVDGMFIGWLEKLDPEVTEEMAMFGEGYRYRAVGQDTWYKATDKGYEAINKAVYDKCQNARVCQP